MNLIKLSDETRTLSSESEKAFAEIQIATNGQEMKVFEFPEMHKGDCIAIGVKLYLFPNGYYVIGGQSRSSDSNDEWKFRIDLLTASDGFLDKVPVYNQYWIQMMPKANTWYNWNIREFEFQVGNTRLASVYNNVHHVKMLCDC